MPRRVDPDAPRTVVRTARVGLRVTPAQRERCFGLLASAGDVWACVLDMNRWRRQRGLLGITSFQQLCRELHQAGPGAFGELNSQCAEGVLHQYSNAWFAAAKRRKDGDATARFPRRKRHLVPVRFRYGRFAIEQQRVRLATARGCPPLWVRLDREVPYPVEQVRSVTLLNEGRRLFVEVTAEVPVATYEPGFEPDPDRVAGVDPGVIHPFAVAGRTGRDWWCRGGRSALSLPGGTITTNAFPVVITHRRAGRHLPGAGPARRDPRRRPHHGTVKRSIGRPRPAPPPGGESLAHARINQHGPYTTNVS